MYKNYFLSIVTLFSMSFAIKAATMTEQQSPAQDIFCSQQYHLSFLNANDEKNVSLISYINQTKTVNRSGCCSWHDGVCGCSAGRAVCCDGSYSPTCGC